MDKLQSIRAAAGPAQTLGLSDSVIKQFLAQFEKLSREFPGAIDQVVGTGLMVSAMLNPKRYRVLGEDGFEQYLRRHGIEMIHGGECGLRFTPSLNITSQEIDMIVGIVRQGLRDLANRD